MNIPREIATDAAIRMLTFRWSDGREQRLTHAQLRRACACAECRRVRFDGRTVSVSSDVTLIDMQMMGYGVQFTFSDGHTRGIYPWPYLERLGSM